MRPDVGTLHGASEQFSCVIDTHSLHLGASGVRPPGADIDATSRITGLLRSGGPTFPKATCQPARGSAACPPVPPAGATGALSITKDNAINAQACGIVGSDAFAMRRSGVHPLNSTRALLLAYVTL